MHLFVSVLQGLDVLEIMRNIHVFVSKYLYNLNNQVDNITDSANRSEIEIEMFVNTLYLQIHYIFYIITCFLVRIRLVCFLMCFAILPTVFVKSLKIVVEISSSI